MTKLKILEIDPWLKPYEKDLKLRMDRYEKVRRELLGVTGRFADFANGHHFFGFHRDENGWVYREWAPAADGLFLIGDFNNWDRTTHPMEEIGGGLWEIRLPGKDTLLHGSRVKVHVTRRGTGMDRIPL